MLLRRRRRRRRQRRMAAAAAAATGARAPLQRRQLPEAFRQRRERVAHDVQKPEA